MMSAARPGPRRVRHAAVVLCALVCVLAQAAMVTAAPVSELEEDLHESRHELDRAREGLETTAESAADARRRLGDIEGRLRSSTERLAVLKQDLAVKRRDLDAAERRLAEAEQVLAAAETATERATQRLIAAEERLRETEARLDNEQGTLETQAAEAYKYGGTSHLGHLLEGVLQAQSPTDAATNWHYVESAYGHQKAVVEEVATLRVLVARHRQEVAAAREERVAEEAIARDARTAVADLTARRQRLVVEQKELVDEQAGLVAVVRRDQAKQKDLLARLQSDRKSYETLVAQLEAESADIATDLADARVAAAAAAREASSSSSNGSSSSGGSSGETVIRSTGSWSAGAPGSSGMVWPTSGSPGSPFGWRVHPVYGTRRLHAGVDVGAPSGQAIVAARAGYVVSAGWRGGYGNAVVIDHGGGLATLYAHQSRLAVTAGESVETGQVIGYIGSTGLSTGPHLHFEVRVNGSPRDPMGWY